MTTIQKVDCTYSIAQLICIYLFPFSSVEMKLQPEPSAVLSQLAQRQQQSSILPTTEPLGLSQLHAPQVPTPPGRTAEWHHTMPL